MTAARFQGLASVDGVIRPIGEACLPVTDRGITLGDAVFETLRTYDGRLFALPAHLERLQASMDAVHMDPAPARTMLQEQARATTRAAVAAIHAASDLPTGTEAVVRITVTRGDGPHGLSLKGTGPCRIVVLARPLRPTDPAVYTKGVRVITARTRRHDPAAQDPRVKATSALNLVMARAEADAAGVDEALLLDAQGRYLEASAANLIVLHDDGYWTPRGDHGVLPGITASVVCGLLDAAGLQAHRGPVPPEVVHQADEVLLTQTTREVIPVVEVDGRPVAHGRPGPQAAALRRGFHAAVPDRLDPEEAG